MEGYDAIFFDVDGTLRRCLVPGQPCPNKAGEWELLDNVRERLVEFDWGHPRDGRTGYGVASNQAGVAWGFIEYEIAYALLLSTFQAAFGFVPELNTIQMCPHKGPCDCRKPSPQMLLYLMELWGVTPERTLFVGDMVTDLRCSELAGCDFRWSWQFFGWGVGSLPLGTYCANKS